MPLYFFRISDGHYAGASDKGSEFASREAAWTEMTKVCGDLLGGLSRGLKRAGGPLELSSRHIHDAHVVRRGGRTSAGSGKLGSRAREVAGHGIGQGQVVVCDDRPGFKVERVDA